MLLSKRVDVIGMGSFPFYYLVKDHGLDLNAFKIVKKLGSFQNVVAFNPDLPNAAELSEAVTRGYRELRETGQLEKMLAKYGVSLWPRELEPIDNRKK